MILFYILATAFFVIVIAVYISEVIRAIRVIIALYENDEETLNNLLP